MEKVLRIGAPAVMGFTLFGSKRTLGLNGIMTETQKRPLVAHQFGFRMLTVLDVTIT